ncbi:MAG: hypothetical protein ACI81I_000186 [Arcobacteraceae bacterium]|jgi:hypothetical protein|tara:strand:+ start:3132 stop:3290 length:159 start_codon:yes stop_codon:yes gene_type:complete
MSKLTKEQIVAELIAEDQITIEEAVTLLTEKNSTVINNFTTPGRFDYTTTTT